MPLTFLAELGIDGRARRPARHDDRPLGPGHRDQPRPRRQDLVAEQARPRRPPGAPPDRSPSGSPRRRRRLTGPRAGPGDSRAWRAASLTHDERRSRTPQQVRRALARAERGAALDVARGHRAAGRERRGPRPALRRRRPGARRGAGRGRPAGGGDLLAQGVHPGHPAVPRPVPLLHVRRVAGQAARAGQAPYLSPDEILDIAREGADAGLPGGAVHPRRPARGPLARGAGLARRAGLRLHAGLRAGDGGPGAGGDRAAAAPQPRRDVVGGDEPAQAGLPLDGDDARDHLAAAVRGPGARPTTAPPTRTPRSGCGCWRTPAGSRSRSPPACWSASARPDRAGRDDLRAARVLRAPSARCRR